jgi:hypothetical protein
MAPASSQPQAEDHCGTAACLLSKSKSENTSQGAVRGPMDVKRGGRGKWLVGLLRGQGLGGREGEGEWCRCQVTGLSGWAQIVTLMSHVTIHQRTPLEGLFCYFLRQGLDRLHRLALNS